MNEHPKADSASRHALVGPPDLWQMKRRFQIDFLMSVGLKPHHRLMDLGCGTLRGGIPLIDFLEQGHYSGVEVRREVLDEAHKELVESELADKAPKLVHCERLAMLDLGQKFDVVWSFQVLIHIGDALLDEVVAAVSRHLDDWGVFYATVNFGTAVDGMWQGFPIVHREKTFYQDVFRRHGLTVIDIGTLKAFGHDHPRLSEASQAGQRILKATRA